MKAVTVEGLIKSLEGLKARGFGQLPIRMVATADLNQIYSKPLESYQVFHDPEIGMFVSFIADRPLSDYLRKQSPLICEFYDS